MEKTEKYYYNEKDKKNMNKKLGTLCYAPKWPLLKQLLYIFHIPIVRKKRLHNKFEKKIRNVIF